LRDRRSNQENAADKILHPTVFKEILSSYFFITTPNKKAFISSLLLDHGWISILIKLPKLDFPLRLFLLIPSHVRKVYLGHLEMRRNRKITE